MGSETCVCSETEPGTGFAFISQLQGPARIGVSHLLRTDRFIFDCKRRVESESVAF